MKHSRILFLFVFILPFSFIFPQKRKLSLSEAVKIAQDSSLMAFKTQNMYLSSYWEYRTYKANRLPKLSLDISPLQYNNNIVKRYDSQNDVDVYKSQKSLSSWGNLSVEQNVGLTGGRFYVDSELGYLRYFGLNTMEQYTAVPFRVGYSQSLFGYNNFKWEKRLAPLRYEKASKELLYNLESISEQTALYFFDLAMNQTLYDLSKQNILNCDTLYQIGMERYKIGSLSQSDLLILKLDVNNAKNDLESREIGLRKSLSALRSYLRINKEDTIELSLLDNFFNVYISEDEAIELAKENSHFLLEYKENILSAQQTLDQTVKANRFSASLSASIGFNQSATTFSDAYSHPLQQDIVAVSMKIPLVDWGVNKGKVNMAKNNLNTVQIAAEQDEDAFEQEVAIVVAEFNMYQSQIKSAKESKEIAQLAFQKAKQLFLIGKTDVSSVNLAVSRQIESEYGYILALRNYWINYYKIRKYTLFDFVNSNDIEIK